MVSAAEVLVRFEVAYGREEASEESLASLGHARTPAGGRRGHPTKRARPARSGRWPFRWPTPLLG
jgi:hypothetical protein